MKKGNRYLIILLALTIISCNCISQNTPKAEDSEKIPKVKVFDKIYPPLNDRQIGTTFNGKRVGLWIILDSTGKVESEETYVNGKNFGVTKVYSDGILFGKISDSLKGSDTISKTEEYSLDGTIIKRGQYFNRIKSGIWLFYFANGKDVKLKVLYDRDKPKILYRSPRMHENIHSLL